MSTIIHKIFVKNGHMRELPRDPANKGKCGVRVVTSNGVADMRLQDLPHLRRSASSYIESKPKVMNRLALRMDEYDPDILTWTINQNSSLVNRLVCYTFAASVWYHYLVEPIFHLSWEEIGEEARSWIINFANSIHISESEPEDIPNLEDFKRTPHLSIISFYRFGTPLISAHSAVVIEIGPERTKYIWEKDGDSRVTLTPFKSLRWKYQLCLGLRARFQDAGKYLALTGLEPVF